MCVCVCVCVCARLCVCVCVRVRVGHYYYYYYYYLSFRQRQIIVFLPVLSQVIKKMFIRQTLRSNRIVVYPPGFFYVII